MSNEYFLVPISLYLVHFWGKNGRIFSWASFAHLFVPFEVSWQLTSQKLNCERTSSKPKSKQTKNIFALFSFFCLKNDLLFNSSFCCWLCSWPQRGPLFAYNCCLTHSREENLSMVVTVKTNRLQNK